MKNDIFDITWSAKHDGHLFKIYFREENKKIVAYFELDGEKDKFDEMLRMGFVEGIASYVLIFGFAKEDRLIEGVIFDSLTIVPSNVNYPGNIALSEDARLMYNLPNGEKLEFKKHVKKMTKLSEIAHVQIGKKLTPVVQGLAMYIKDYNFDREVRVNECMVDNEHAVFFGISKDNINFFTDCDDNSGRYCAAENIAVLTNIESRFDKPYISFELQEQVKKLLNESNQQILTLEQVKNILLDDEKYKNRVLNIEGLNLIL